MRKIVFVGLVAISTMFGANSAKDIDILAQATTTKVDGTKLALAKSEAKNVKGGWYGYYSSRYNRYSSYRKYYSNPYSRSYRGTYRSYIYSSYYWRKWKDNKHAINSVFTIYRIAKGIYENR